MSSEKTDALLKEAEEMLGFEREDEKIALEAEMINIRIMQKIEKLMQEKGLSKKLLADELKTSKGYVTRLFTADKLINLKTLARLQRIFNVSFEIESVKKLRSIKSADCKIHNICDHYKNSLPKGKEYEISPVPEQPNKLVG